MKTRHAQTLVHRKESIHVVGGVAVVDSFGVGGHGRGGGGRLNDVGEGKLSEGADVLEPAVTPRQGKVRTSRTTPRLRQSMMRLLPEPYLTQRFSA